MTRLLTFSTNQGLSWCSISSMIIVFYTTFPSLLNSCKHQGHTYDCFCTHEHHFDVAAMDDEADDSKFLVL